MQPTTATISSNNQAQAQSKWRTGTTASYYLMFIVYGMTFAVLGPTLPGLAEQTQADLKAISYLFVARSAGSLFGSLISGALYDRKAGHGVMVAFLILMALTLVLSPMVPLLWLLLAVTFMLGLAQGGLNVGGNALLVWVHPKDSAPYMNGLHFFFGAGTFLAPIIIAQSILKSGDINWSYWIMALLMLLPIPGLLRLASPKLERSEQSVQQQAGTSRPLLALLVALFLFCYSGAANCFGGWIYTYAFQQGLASETGAAYLTSAFWGALTLGRLLAIPLAMRFKPSTLLWGDIIGSLICLGLILLLPHNPIAVWIGSAGLGLALASWFPTTVSMAGRSMPVTGKITGWFSVGASLGALILPLLVGQFFESVGPQVLMWVLLIDILVAGVTLMWMLRHMQPARQKVS